MIEEEVPTIPENKDIEVLDEKTYVEILDSTGVALIIMKQKFKVTCNELTELRDAVFGGVNDVDTNTIKLTPNWDRKIEKDVDHYVVVTLCPQTLKRGETKERTLSYTFNNYFKSRDTDFRHLISKNTKKLTVFILFPSERRMRRLLVTDFRDAVRSVGKPLETEVYVLNDRLVVWECEKPKMNLYYYLRWEW